MLVASKMLNDLSDHCAALAREGRLIEAEEGLRRLLALDPDHLIAKGNLAHVLLAQGKYDEAAVFHEERHAAQGKQRRKPDLPYPEWTGEPVAGKRFLIFPEQGLGDQIMAGRFAPELARAGADVTLICSPLLERLFSNNLGVTVLPAKGEVTFADPDYWCMSDSLFTTAGVTPSTIPAAPYLSGAASRRGGVGIKTLGNPKHVNDANRSLPPEAGRELARLVDGIDLDPTATGARDMQDTADIIAGLDLVISVDTAVAHLAGAMGKPVWILLPAFATDWRWMRGRQDSPWYPSARLFRQARPGDWSSVLAEVAAALSAS